MVGFIHHDEDEEINLSPKLKNPVDSTWCDKLDFLDQFVPEIDDLSLPVNGSLLDFDSIKDWIEEMQDPEVEKRSETVKNNGGDVLAEGPGVEENACFLETELTVGIIEKLVSVDGSGECLGKESEGFENSPVEDGDKLLSLNNVVEEGLGKVSFQLNLVDQSSSKDNVVVSEVVEDDSDESSDSESERESLSDSSESSSLSSDEDEDDDAVDEGEKNGVIKEGVCEVNEELEEGEIMETDADRMVSWSNVDGIEGDSKDSFIKDGASGEILMDDDDDEDVVVGPIRSKHEVKVLPPVPPVDVTLQPSHQMLPVGVVNSILGAQVVVEGGEKHNPLNEGSILWITEKRCPLGRVDEIFGPVKNPYYIVRYNSESEVPKGIHEGCLVSFVPEFVDHVLNHKNLYQKGYDASGNDDEEVDEEAEFSDDEKEAEYKRMLKTSKRGNKADMKPGDYKKSNKSFIRNDTRSNNSMHMQAKDLPQVRPNNINMQNHSVQPDSSRFRPSGIQPSGFPQQGQPSGFRPNGNEIQPNGMPAFQMQNRGFANGFQMPWVQQHQNFHPNPMMNTRPPFQQAFNPAGPTPNSMIPSNTPMGPSFSPLPAGTTMDPNALNQVSMALQAQLAQLSMLSGMLLAGQQGGPSSLPQNAQAAPPQQFNQGPTSSHHGAPPQLNQGAMSSHHRGPPQFNQGPTSSHHGAPPPFNEGPTSSHQEAPPQQFNQGATLSHQGGPPQQMNQGSTSPHQGPPPQQFNQGATSSHQGAPPQFNQGLASSHHGGNRPFQNRGGRSRGRGGRRGGGRPFQSR